jgi:hypothetical protein
MQRILEVLVRALLTVLEYVCIAGALVLAVQIHNGNVVHEPVHAIALGFAISSLLYFAYVARAAWRRRATSSESAAKKNAVPAHMETPAAPLPDQLAGRLVIEHASVAFVAPVAQAEAPPTPVDPVIRRLAAGTEAVRHREDRGGRRGPHRAGQRPWHAHRAPRPGIRLTANEEPLRRSG